MSMARLMFTCCFLLASAAAFAQSPCAQSITIRQGRCSSGGCSDVFPITTLVGCSTRGCFEIQTVSTDCCGQTIQYYDFDNRDCLMAEVKDPGKRTDLLALAATANVLVRDCKGSFIPLSTVLDVQRADNHAQAMN